MLDAGDILLLKTYGQGPYAKPIKAVEDDIQKTIKRVNELTGIKESDTGTTCDFNLPRNE